MPRKTRPKPGPGGSGAKAERTDLMQPAAAPTGMPYGAHKESIEAQQAVPMAGAPTSAPAPAGPGGPAGAGGGPDAAALQAAMAMPSPDGDVGLTGPTLNPNEPIQAGLSSGPGPGPAAMTLDTPRAASLLQQLAVSSGNPAMAELAELARQQGA